MRAVLGVVFFAMVASGVAVAEDGGKAESKKPAPAAIVLTAEDAKATALLEKIVAGPDAAARTAAIAQLNELAPRAVAGLGAWLARPHASSVAERREILGAIDAAVPDKSGKFAVPSRKTNKELKADDELDWLKSLLAQPERAGLGEVIADVAAIRALATTQDITAPKPIFDAAFADETMIYRDECGRYMRKMEPWSIPFLTRMSQVKNYDRRRYATYQLERLDRQEPAKALGAATGNEALQIAILDVFRETRLREAVTAVWKKVNDDAPRVRAAARRTWMDYITGPPPPPAPKKKLQMPGGKLTKKEKPLWLTYRELADNELRRAANALLHEDYKIPDESNLDAEREERIEPIDLEDVTKRLFAHYDGERAKQESAQWAEAKTKADAGDLASAATMLDRLIATNPERAERTEMAKVYAAHGKALAAKSQWSEASAAYSKAHGLDPKSPAATEVLAAHHFTLGKALEAVGKDGGPDFRKALALKPDYAPAEKAEATSVSGSGGKPFWMLYAAGGAALVALLCFALAMVRRRTA